VQTALKPHDPNGKTLLARYVSLWVRWTLWISLALIIEEILRALIEQVSPPRPPYDHPLLTLESAFIPYILIMSIL
jgi:hypothetical protein